MALNGAANYPQACQALSSMLSRNTLNPADITVLFRNYSTADPPPIDLIRVPQFLGMNLLPMSQLVYGWVMYFDFFFFRIISRQFIQTRSKTESRT